MPRVAISLKHYNRSIPLKENMKYVNYKAYFQLFLKIFRKFERRKLRFLKVLLTIFRSSNALLGNVIAERFMSFCYRYVLIVIFVC